MTDWKGQCCPMLLHHVREKYSFPVYIFKTLSLLVFTARSCYRMSSVCPSVTLVDHDHIGWKSWKPIAWTISPTSSLFVAQRSSTYSQGKWRNFGETRGGVGKVACWSTKVAISLKRVKLEEKLLWRAYRKSSTLFRFLGLPPYFYFRFRLYGHRNGRFCLVLARTAQQLVLDGTNGLSSGEPCAYCRIVQIGQKCKGASRGLLCDSTAFLLIKILLQHHSC